jgi:CHAT domain-containing protein
MHGVGAGSTRDLATAPEPVHSADQESASERLIAELAEALQLDSVLAALPNRVRALTIIPDDVLHGLPFAALRHEGQYLIEKFTLSVGFMTLSPARPRRRVPAPRFGLVVGVSRGLGNLPDLPQVPVEIQSVAAWLSRRGLAVRTLIDDDASRHAVLDCLRAASLAHIACHGTFEPDRPDRSGIVLVPEPGCEEMVTLRDLSDLRFEHCRHVTLSSCWSADNFILPGRWIISLPETLWRSGVETTLGSLWAVDDDVGAAFMSRFYAGLERLPRDAALRDAQLAALANQLDCSRVRGSRPIDTSATFFWAGYMLYGEPGRLQP